MTELTKQDRKHRGTEMDKHICIHCGKEFYRRLTRHKYKYPEICWPCIKAYYNNQRPAGQESHAWKGGRTASGNGYIEIYVNPDDFFYPMANPKKKDGISKCAYVLEHRLVMAKHIKRCLLPWEVVHHKNGIKNDNRLENLELLPSRAKHLVDMVSKAYIKKLETEIKRLNVRIERLENEK